MDAKEMYNAAKHLTSLMEWENDWIHFGTENEIKFDIVLKFIDVHLKYEELLFIEGRQNSTYYKKKQIIDFISPLLGKENFQLWTIEMDKVIQFNRIGILRLGQTILGPTS